MKIKRSDLNECIAEAIVRVVKESWEDDVVNAAMSDKKAKKAFDKDSEKENNASEKDDAKNAAADAIDMSVEDDEEELGYGVESLHDYSYRELLDAMKKDVEEHGGKKTSSFYKQLNAERTFRKHFQDDAKAYMSGEIRKPYGIDFYTEDDGRHFAGEMYYTHDQVGRKGTGVGAYSVNGDFGGTNFGWGRRNADPDLPAGEQTGQFKRY